MIAEGGVFKARWERDYRDDGDFSIIYDECLTGTFRFGLDFATQSSDSHRECRGVMFGRPSARLLIPLRLLLVGKDSTAKTHSAAILIRIYGITCIWGLLYGCCGLLSVVDDMDISGKENGKRVELARVRHSRG